MSSNIGGRKRQWLWAVVPIIVLLEVVLQWRIPLDVPDDGDWARAAKNIQQQKTPHDLVIIAPHWADQGRKYLSELMAFKDFGRFDTTRYDRIFEVSAFGATAPETHGREPATRFVSGKVEVRTYNLPKRAEIVYDFRDHVQTASVEGVGSVSPKIMIDREFQPRFAIPVSLRRGKGVLTFKNVPLNRGVLRGYRFLDYREARYNKGQPVMFRIYINGKKVSEQLTNNFDPITEFQLELQGPETGDVRFEIVARDNLKREFGFTCDVRQSS